MSKADYTVMGYIFQYFGRHGLPSSGCDNISHYCVIGVANFRTSFNLSLIRSSTTRGSGTSVLSRWSLLKLLRLKSIRPPMFTHVSIALLCSLKHVAQKPKTVSMI